MVAYESLKTKEKSSWVIPKVVAVAQRSSWELFIIKFKLQFKRGFTEVVAYEGARKESFDCMNRYQTLFNNS